MLSVTIRLLYYRLKEWLKTGFKKVFGLVKSHPFFFLFVTAFVLLIAYIYLPQYRPYETKQPASQIQAIEVYTKTEDTGSFSDPMTLDYVVPPKDHEAFFSELNALRCHNPVPPHYGYGKTVIRITYQDGAVEQITRYGGIYYISALEKQHIGSMFDEEAYLNLIDAFRPKAE